jgi:hypothetical protein
LHSGGRETSGQPTEEELRAAYEAELSRITSTDMMAQATVSLLNIGARRLGLLTDPKDEPAKEPDAESGRDLEQVRDAIDGAKALLEILERRIPGELRSLRDALSQLQMAYAREVQGAGATGQAPPASTPPAPSPPASTPPGAKGAPEAPPAEQPSDGPGPAESSGRLWVPGR